MVVHPHGGPNARDTFGYDPYVQFLASRGYVVFHPNFRGSTGYGATPYILANKQFGKTMQDDITDGVNYLINSGVADKNRIAIFGGSYGGFMTMAAMTFEPEEFKVGVNIYGVTNWIRTLRSIPAYWESTRESLYKEMGNPYTEDSLRLYNISPLFHAKNIKNPVMVLQGANDPRVLQIESDEMVQEARDAGAYVEYVLFEDAGHGFIKKEQQIEGNEKILTFLENYLK